MTLPADRRSPNLQSNWEPVPLHVPVDDRLGDIHSDVSDEQERETERPLGSYVCVIELA